jgi:uncharacterized membrane protein
MSNDLQTQGSEEPRTLTQVLYALHTVTWFSGGIFSVIAIVINMLNFASLPDDFYRSHWRWQSRTFWFALIAFLVTAPLWLLFVFPGWIAYIVIGLWYLYRCVRGWIAFNDGRPMPA